jgi:membrane fusion protein (multidrug efflux system)
MNRNPIILLLLAVLIFSSCKNKSAKVREKPPVQVDVIVAQKVHFQSTIEVNGEVLSQESVDLHPEINGRLTYLNIPDGASVKAGTVLARINDADLVAQLEQQRVQYDLAIKTEQRLSELLKVNGINQADYDAAVSQVNSVNANIKVLNAQIDKSVVRAPFTGRLGLRVVSPGAYVTPQTLLGTLEKSDSIKIDFTVPEYYADLAKAGDSVSIQTNETDRYQSAVISAIEPQINTSSRNIKARARLKGGNISPGTFVKVRLNKEENGILVPSNALIPDATSNQVIVIRKNRGVFVNVVTGVRNADQVELSKGINTGDTIVINGVLFVRPNAKVKIRTVKDSNSISIPDSNKVSR